MTPDRVAIDHASSVIVSVSVRGHHVGLAYKLWSRQSAADSWVVVGTGISDDVVTDTFDLGKMSPGATLAFWFAVAGPKDETYRVDLLFIQKGQPVSGGPCEEAGTLGADEAIAIEGRVAFP